jgi:hypothetical protein
MHEKRDRKAICRRPVFFGTETYFMDRDIAAEEPLLLLIAFVGAAHGDPRISSYHISVYASLLFFWQKKNYQSPLSFFSSDIMPYCKISGSATFHRILKELHAYGYVHYTPSYNHFLGSLVSFVSIRQAAP